jgi:hypothetical protein
MCIITAHAIFISPTIKYNIMNSDSKLKRFIVLLDKAPFILFLESANYLPHADHLIPALNIFKLSSTDALVTAPIKPDQDLRKIISATNTLDDPLAYNIIEALADAALNLNTTHFPVHFFTKSGWQNYIDWQNVDAKTEPQCDFTITINKFTHVLHIVYSNDIPQNGTSDYDGFIQLRSLDPSVPFPLSLLKDCVINIHDIIVQESVGRTITAMTESKYLSVMQTGHDSFNYINMKKLEKDLRAVLTTANITIEQ